MTNELFIILRSNKFYGININGSPCDSLTELEKKLLSSCSGKINFRDLDYALVEDLSSIQLGEKVVRTLIYREIFKF